MRTPTTRTVVAATTAALTVAVLAGCAGPIHAPLPAGHGSSAEPTEKPTPSADRESSSGADSGTVGELADRDIPFEGSAISASAEPALEFPISDLEQQGWTVDNDASKPEEGQWIFRGPGGVEGSAFQSRTDDIVGFDDRAATEKVIDLVGLPAEPTDSVLQRSGGGTVQALSIENETGAGPTIGRLRVFAKQGVSIAVAVRSSDGDLSTLRPAADTFFDLVKIQAI